jgi:transcriptional regulator
MLNSRIYFSVQHSKVSIAPAARVAFQHEMCHSLLLSTGMKRVQGSGLRRCRRVMKCRAALDLMVLKTLAAMGPLHGYGIARRIEQAANGAVALNQGTIYPALLRLEQKAWISSDWGTSENNRRARFYTITAAGRKQLAAEAKLWAEQSRW